MCFMCPAALLLALSLTVNETASAQRLDTSSDATLQLTTAAARNELPEAQRHKFDQAMKVLMADFVEKQGDEVSREQFVAELRAALDGKTANDVIVAAEIIARTMLGEHARKQAATASRVLPAAKKVHGTSFVCDSLLNTAIKLDRADEAEYFEVTETSLLKSDAEIRALLERRQLAATATTGNDTLAIEIVGGSLKVMTRASVEMGQASPAIFTIAQNDDTVLVAYAIDDATLGVIVDSVLFNKKNGLAVWTKSRSASILGDEPATQTLYLRCR
jgi:hypothetical protein